MINFNLAEEYISGDRFLEFSDVIIDSGIKRDENHRPTGEVFKNVKNISKLNTKNCIIFCKTDYIGQLFNYVKNSKYSHVLITFNSDYPITAKIFSAKPASIKYWFAQNAAVRVNNLIPLPVGLERYFAGCNSFDVNVLIDQLKQKKQIKNWVYLNHNINTNISDRKPILDKFKDASFVTYEQGATFKDYISSLYNHTFCFSPPGNGIDCHRTWESIYLGCIPIVKSSYLTKSFSDLPIIIYENIDEITKSFLLTRLIELNKTDFNYEKATFSYWKNRITMLKKQL